MLRNRESLAIVVLLVGLVVLGMSAPADANVTGTVIIGPDEAFGPVVSTILIDTTGYERLTVSKPSRVSLFFSELGSRINWPRFRVVGGWPMLDFGGGDW